MNVPLEQAMENSRFCEPYQIGDVCSLLNVILVASVFLSEAKVTVPFGCTLVVYKHIIVRAWQLSFASAAQKLNIEHRASNKFMNKQISCIRRTGLGGWISLMIIWGNAVPA